MNVIIIIGRLGKDPELTRRSTDKAMCRFSVAVNKRKKDAGADWFDVTCFEKTAEFVSNYGTKGREVAVKGRMESRKDDSGKTWWSVVADEVTFVGGVRDGAPGKPQGDEYDPFAE